MKPTTVCIPTLNRYDKLIKLINSLTINVTMLPTKIYILDNGTKFPENVLQYLNAFQKDLIDTFTFGKNIGVAKSWNFFIKNTNDIRIICNDDILFRENTLEVFYNNWSENYITWAGGVSSANAFSCFSIPDNIVNQLGYFDETISPNYAYFEDNDYFRRNLLSGLITPVPIPAEVEHETSSTLKGFTSEETNEHNRKFEIAKSNYIKKWGGLPGKETFDKPYNRG